MFGTDSAAVNALDDYEEGTWAPSILNGTFTYSKQIGNYTKVGNIVNATMYISWTAVSGTGSFRVSLPFTANGNSTNNRYAGTIGYHKGFIRASDVNLVISASGDQNNYGLHGVALDGTVANYGVSSLADVGEIQATITYQVK